MNRRQAKIVKAIIEPKDAQREEGRYTLSVSKIGVIMRTAFSKLDKILVRTGRYPSKRELIEDAIRTLLRAKPELKMDVAIELYKKSEVSLSRASEICGLYIEDFKELLKEKGIKISVPSIPNKEVDKEVERILGAGLPRPHFDPL